MILHKSVNFQGDENNLKHIKETQSSNKGDKLVNISVIQINVFSSSFKNQNNFLKSKSRG